MKKYVRYVGDIRAWEKLSDAQRIYLNKLGACWDNKAGKYRTSGGQLVDKAFWKRNSAVGR